MKTNSQVALTSEKNDTRILQVLIRKEMMTWNPHEGRLSSGLSAIRFSSHFLDDLWKMKAATLQVTTGNFSTFLLH